MALIIAHRGASGYAPENTMAAFEKALEMGAEGIELDVHLTADGEIVVIHDHTIDRTSDGKGVVGALTLEEIRKYDFGAWFDPKFKGQRIPTLGEVFELLEDWDGLLNIEVKSGPILYPGIEEKLVDMVKSWNFRGRIIFSSFNHYSLRDIKALDPSMEIGLLYMAGLVEPWKYAKDLNAQALHPLYYNVVPELVAGCKENGIKLNPFTIDEEKEMEMIMRAGVDGIITDYPDRALNVRKRISG
ncbi:MAG: glycerophosphodiester phosphodiesterase [Caldicoprobacterales bacterium]|jgi:glycerophosphoryl diester phosphodiesterase|nr:glycerophosphodiester phosphodiesterase [Clostridiales bacterium]